MEILSHVAKILANIIIVGVLAAGAWLLGFKVKEVSKEIVKLVSQLWKACTQA